MPRSASGAGSHHHAEARTGRKLVEIAQVARGRTPLKYEFEVIPFFAGEQLAVYLNSRAGQTRQQLCYKATDH